MTPLWKITVLVACLGVCGAAVFYRNRMAPLPPPRPAELYAVIAKQISAFRGADYPGAYREVSTQFQEKFNLDAFADHVRGTYPEVLRAEHVEFGEFQIRNRHALVRVYFILGGGDVLPCLYSLVREDGGWKIEGAKLQKRSPSSERSLGGIRT